MKTGQGFLLVFSITSQSSLSELSELREQIIRIKDDENVPIVIVGNKSDLEEHRAVSRAKAFGVSQSWGNAPYYETSARRRGQCWQPLRDTGILTSTTCSERGRSLHRSLPADHTKRQPATAEPGQRHDGEFAQKRRNGSDQASTPVATEEELDLYDIMSFAVILNGSLGEHKNGNLWRDEMG